MFRIKTYTCILGDAFLLSDPVSCLLLSFRLSSFDQAYKQVECKENKIKADGQIDYENEMGVSLYLLEYNTSTLHVYHYDSC